MASLRRKLRESVYNESTVPRLDLKTLRSVSTARTYPVEAEELTRAIEEAVRSLPRWTLARVDEEEIQAIRKTRLGFEDDATVRLTTRPVGAYTNTHAEFQSTSRIGLWDLGQNGRNLKELIAAIDQELAAES